MTATGSQISHLVFLTMPKITVTWRRFAQTMPCFNKGWRVWGVEDQASEAGALEGNLSDFKNP